MRGIISCGHKATAMAADMAMQEGGNAFDSAVSALMVACVSEPCIASFSSGLIGLIKTSAQEVKMLDSFAKAPERRRPNVESELIPFKVDFVNEIDTYYYGKGSVTVGGYAHAIEILSEFGNLPFQICCDITVDSIKNGIELSSFFRQYLKYIRPTFENNGILQELYCTETGEIKKVGDIIKNEGFNDFIDTIRNEGIKLYSHGEVSKEIIEIVNDAGHLRRADLNDFKARLCRPHRIMDNDKNVYIPDFPSWGGEMIRRFSLSDESSYEKIFSSVIGKIEDEDLRRKWIVRNSSGLQSKYGGTGHMSIVDEKENIISLTYSLGEGSGLMTPNSGIHLNNMLGEPALFSGEIDSWNEGEKLISMMSPLIIERNDAYIALGSGGSERIPQIMFQAMSKIVNEPNKYILSDAIETSKIFLKNNIFHYEPGYEIDNRLKGYEFNEFDEKNMFFGGINATAISSDRFTAHADSRRNGIMCEIGS